MQMYGRGLLQVAMDNGKNAPEKFQGLDSIFRAVDVRKLNKPFTKEM